MILTVPLAIAALTLSAHDGPSAGMLRLIDQSQQIRWGSTDLSWIGQVWPPVPVGAAALVGGQYLAMTLIGALAGGGLAFAILEHLVVARQPWWVVSALTCATGLSPTLLLLTTADFSRLLALACMLTALPGFLQFICYGRTEGGFRAGLLFGVAVACDISVLFYTVALAAAGAAITRRRMRGHRHAAVASALVLSFPAVMAVLCWSFLEWRSTGDALSAWQHAGVPPLSDVSMTVGDLLTGLFHTVLLSPLYIIVGFVLGRRSVAGLLAYALPLAAVVVAAVVGLHMTTVAGVVMLSGVAAVSVPPYTRAGPCTVIAVAALAQWTLGLVLLL